MTLHVLPTLPPERNGLADYAHKLFLHWPDKQASWQAIVLRIPTSAPEAWPGLSVERMVPNAQDLMRCLESSKPKKLVLHYVPHAYDANGVPSWLIEGLAKSKGDLGFGLFTIFHELFVVPRRFGRSTLYQRPSKRLFTQLITLSDAWSTSTDRYWDQILAAGGNPAAGRKIPIGTNIESSQAPTFDLAEKIELAVFGLAETRRRTLDLHASWVSSMHDRQRLAGITLLGASGSERDAELALVKRLAPTVPVRTCFDATEAEVSSYLLTCQAGLCFNPPDIITKSGVYAAFCAHGLAPVLPIVDRSPEAEGPWISATPVLPSPEQIHAKRIAARAWFEGAGSWSAITAALFAGIQGIP